MRKTGSRSWVVSRMLLVTLVLSAAVQVAGAAGQTPQVGQGSDPGVEPLWPGDAIRLAFWREPELNGDYQIDESGQVILPIVGSRSVTGMAPSELMDGLLADYARELASPDVAITLLRRVRILGAVSNPGLYLVDPTMTLADALALAGGTTREGKLTGIRVMRDGTEVHQNLASGVRLAEGIRSGDQILVPERSWLSRHSTVVVGGLISATALILARLLIDNNSR